MGIGGCGEVWVELFNTFFTVLCRLTIEADGSFGVLCGLIRFLTAFKFKVFWVLVGASTRCLLCSPYGVTYSCDANVIILQKFSEFICFIMFTVQPITV